jgi:glucosamine kinase
MPESHYFLGIDGGGTGCRARLTDVQGRVLGQGGGGPANVGLGLDVVLDSVMCAAREALAAAHLCESTLAATHAGLGIAGANVPRHREALQDLKLPFLSVAIRSDAEIACLGAHAGNDGGILILGTGSQGVILRDGSFTTIGGWGFALSDSGSGSILGRAAVRRAFMAHEAVEPASPLTHAILGRFDHDATQMLEWADRARPKDWGEFGRTVFEFARQGDAVATELVQDSARDVERMLDRMIELGATRISLMGGVAVPTRPLLSARFDPVLVEPGGDAMDGALRLARRLMP